MASKFLIKDTLKLLDKIMPRLTEATTFRIVQACTLAIPNRVGAEFDWWRHIAVNSISNRQYWVGRLGLECCFGNQLISLNEFARRRYTWKFFK